MKFDLYAWKVLLLKTASSVFWLRDTASLEVCSFYREATLSLVISSTSNVKYFRRYRLLPGFSETELRRQIQYSIVNVMFLRNLFVRNL